METIDRLLAIAIDCLAPLLERRTGPGRTQPDAMTTVISLDAGGIRGTVWLPDPGDPTTDPDLVDLIAVLADPAERVLAGREPAVYSAPAYRASFTEEDPELPGVIAWPWEEDVPSASLIPAVDGGLVPTVTLRPEQVALVTEVPADPRSDIVLATPDGRALRMFLRPLLPDELTTDADGSG